MNNELNLHGAPIYYKAKTLYLTQQAYISDCGTYYKAVAEYIDENEIVFEFLITWDVINPVSMEDESDACNWDEYKVREYGEKLI